MLGNVKQVIVVVITYGIVDVGEFAWINWVSYLCCCMRWVSSGVNAILFSSRHRLHTTHVSLHTCISCWDADADRSPAHSPLSVAFPFVSSHNMGTHDEPLASIAPAN